MENKNIEEILEFPTQDTFNNEDMSVIEEKYNQAKKEILEWIETEGLRIAESKLKVLIESAVSKNKKEV